MTGRVVTFTAQECEEFGRVLTGGIKRALRDGQRPLRIAETLAVMCAEVRSSPQQAAFLAIEVAHPDAAPIDVISRREAARMMGISEDTLDRQVKAGQLPHFRAGRRVLFHRDELLSVVRGAR